MMLIDSSRCVGCGKCVKDCVNEVIVVENGKAVIQGRCIECGHCAAICPVGAVTNPEYDMADVENRRDGVILDPDALVYTLKFRRSIRQYQPRPVEREKLEKIIQAARYSATGANCQGCHVTVVQEEMEHFQDMVWDGIEAFLRENEGNLPRMANVYPPVLARYRENRADDRIIYGAPCAIVVAAESQWDAGLASQSMELAALAQGLGIVYSGYLRGAVSFNKELQNWLGIGELPVQTCMMLGYPAVDYLRSAPRKPANVIWR